MGFLIGDLDSTNNFNSKEVKANKNAKPFFAQQLEKKKVVKRK